MFETYQDMRFASSLCDMADFFMRRREQYTIVCGKEDVATAIDRELEKKSVYVSHIDSGNTVTIVFEAF